MVNRPEWRGGVAMPPLSPLLTAPLACTAISGEAVPTYLPPSPLLSALLAVARPPKREVNLIVPEYHARDASVAYTARQAKLVLLVAGRGLKLWRNEYSPFVTTCSEQEKIIGTPCSLKKNAAHDTA